MEFAMFDELVRECMDRGVNRIVGYYYPTPKNAMVAELFPQLGFTLTTRSETGNTEWAFDVGSSHDAKTIAIKVVR